jgi:hypothetical protein
MLVGEPPYTGSVPQAVLAKIITTEPASAAETRKSVPPFVDATKRLPTPGRVNPFVAPGTGYRSG